MAPKRSDVWKHFKCINNDSTICRYCDKVVKTSGNTSNMKNHLTLAHLSILQSEKEETEKKRSNPESKSESKSENLSKKLKVEPAIKASTSRHTKVDNIPAQHPRPSGITENIKDVFGNIKAFEEGGIKHKKLTNQILHMICEDSQAIATVERKGFKDLIKYLAPHYKIPSKKSFGSYLDKKYEQVSEVYKEKLKGVTDITLTTDLWTDTLNSTSFLGITVHFLDGSKMVSTILGCYKFSMSHTSANIEEKIREVCGDWGIKKEQLSAIVTDNAANVVKAVRDFLPGKKELIDTHRMALKKTYISMPLNAY